MISFRKMLSLTAGSFLLLLFPLNVLAKVAFSGCRTNELDPISKYALNETVRELAYRSKTYQ